jgi:hypothetical protein
MSIVYPGLIANATNLEAELNCTIHTIWLWGEIDTPRPYSTLLIIWGPSACGIICFTFYTL